MSERPFTPAEDAEPADWLVERLTDFAVNVLSVVPSGFEAYARVFHPASKVTCTADMAQESTSEPLRWADVAELTGRTAHRLMQWASIQGSHSALNDYTKLKAGDVYIEPPEEGSLPLELAQTLWPILEPHTKTSAMCFFAIWEGFGGLPNFIREAPAFEIPDRRFYLFRAPLQTIEQSFYTGVTYDDTAGGGIGVTIANGSEIPSPAELQKLLSSTEVQEQLRALHAEMPVTYQSANLWWPEDRAWCVHTEIDLNTTYIGGSQRLIDAILASEKLEAYQLEPTDQITYDSDTLNPLPNDPYGNSFKLSS